MRNDINIRYLRLGGSCLHDLKGSPVKPCKHEHTGIWFTTSHSALMPQTPWHGSRQFCATQAKWLGQSELITHSGRQLTYAFPWYGGIHVQRAIPSRDVHWAFSPHGERLHGSRGKGGFGSAETTDNTNHTYKHTHISTTHYDY